MADFPHIKARGVPPRRRSNLVNAGPPGGQSIGTRLAWPWPMGYVPAPSLPARNLLARNFVSILEPRQRKGACITSPSAARPPNLAPLRRGLFLRVATRPMLQRQGFDVWFAFAGALVVHIVTQNLSQNATPLMDRGRFAPLGRLDDLMHTTFPLFHCLGNFV